MTVKTSPAPAFLAVGLAACDDRQARNDTQIRPTGARTGPPTDRSAPATRHEP